MSMPTKTSQASSSCVNAKDLDACTTSQAKAADSPYQNHVHPPAQSTDGTCENAAQSTDGTYENATQSTDGTYENVDQSTDGTYEDAAQSAAVNAQTEAVNAETAAELKRLREEIDAADEAIAALLRVRTSLVRSAARLKSQSGEGVVSGNREEQILFHGAQLEQKYGLAPSLMQDLQRRILRQSYIEKGSDKYASAHQQSKSNSSASERCKVCIVGGAGGMGSYFVRYLSGAGYDVSVVEPHDYKMDHEGNEVADITKSIAAERLAKANWCIISVPIDKTNDVIKQVSSLINKDCILSDLTSIKSEPLQTMLKYHSGPVVGLHPMFGPDTVSFVKQVVVVVNGREDDKCAFIAKQMRLFGAHVVSCSADEHDSAMRVIQALRHFTTIAYGNFLRERFGSAADNCATTNEQQQNNAADEHFSKSDSPNAQSQKSNYQSAEYKNIDSQGADSPFVARLMDICSPIYHLELLMVGRLFAQSPELYCDIISASDKNLELIEQYIDCAARCLQLLKHKDRDSFINEFKSTTNFFGPYAQGFLKESGRILALVQDTFAADK